MTEQTSTSALRLEITGHPSPQQVAAVTAAVAGLAAAIVPTGVPPVPAWGRAARVEALGQAPFTSSTDSRLQYRRSGALPPGVS